MAIGLSGLASGMDTESLITQLMKAQNSKKDEINGKITKVDWKKDTWKDLNKKIYSFYTESASKLRLQSSYQTKSAKSSNESIVSAKTSATAAMGTHSLRVNSLASSQYVTGAKTSKVSDTSTKLVDAGVAEGTIVTLKTGVGTAEEKTTTIEVTSSTTVANFLQDLKNGGISATYDKTQKRFFFSSLESGEAHKFTIEVSGGAGAATARNELDTLTGYSTMSADDQKKVNDAYKVLYDNSGIVNSVITNGIDPDTATDAEKAVKSALDTIKELSVTKNEENLKKKAKDELVEELKTSVQSSIAAGTDISLYGVDIALSDLVDESEIKVKERGATAEGNKEMIDAAKATKADFDYTALRDAAYAAGYITDDLYDSGNITDEAAYEGIIGYLKDLDQNGLIVPGTDESALYDAYLDTVLETVKDSAAEKVLEGDGAKTELETRETAQADALKASIESKIPGYLAAQTSGNASGLASLGIYNITGTQVKESNAATGGMVVVAASDAEVVLDGATMKADSNNFTVNGISLTLNSVTPDGDNDTQITVTKDISSVYDMVKDCLKKYNELIDELNEKLYAESARKYTMLTDEQKEAMTDDEVEKWEDKIKSALLRGDTTLSSLLSSMRTALNSNYKTDDGKTFTLSSFGIVSGNYTERGKLHIYGDSEDTTYATYDDKLKKALEDDPETVTNALSSIFGKLYSTLTEKCSKTTLSSALTFYNDKQIDNEKKDYESDLETLQDRLDAIEDRYRTQFTAMEKAMSEMNNKMNAMSSMLGLNTNQ